MSYVHIPYQQRVDKVELYFTYRYFKLYQQQDHTFLILQQNSYYTIPFHMTVLPANQPSLLQLYFASMLVVRVAGLKESRLTLCHFLFKKKGDKNTPVELISYWHPNLTINLIDDQTQWSKGSVPSPLDEGKLIIFFQHNDLVFCQSKS